MSFDNRPVPLATRLALAARIAACALAGSAAGLLVWAIVALGLGSLVWAAPLVVVAALVFGLPSLGLLVAAALVFARQIFRHTAGCCVTLPLVASAAWMVAWSAPAPGDAVPPDGTLLVGLCAAASSALFYGWSRSAAAVRRSPACA